MGITDGEAMLAQVRSWADQKDAARRAEVKVIRTVRECFCPEGDHQPPYSRWWFCPIDAT